MNARSFVLKEFAGFAKPLFQTFELGIEFGWTDWRPRSDFVIGHLGQYNLTSQQGRQQVIRTVESIDLLAGDVTTTATQVEQLAGQVREKRFGSSMPGDFRERSRQMRFLQQRGFDAEQIRGLFRDEDF